MKQVFVLCPGRDSNPHGENLQQILSLFRLPVTTPGHILRPGRELHSRIALLQSAALLLGYLAILFLFKHKLGDFSNTTFPFNLRQDFFHPASFFCFDFFNEFYAGHHSNVQTAIQLLLNIINICF